MDESKVHETLDVEYVRMYFRVKLPQGWQGSIVDFLDEKSVSAYTRLSVTLAYSHNWGDIIPNDLIRKFVAACLQQAVDELKTPTPEKVEEFITLLAEGDFYHYNLLMSGRYDFSPEYCGGCADLWLAKAADVAAKSLYFNAAYAAAKSITASRGSLGMIPNDEVLEETITHLLEML